MKVEIAGIIVREDRFRGATGDMNGLAESLSRFGQLVPIILAKNQELIAGFRRLTAAKSLGWTEIDAVFQGEIPLAVQREIELEENLQRQDMSWHEIVAARAELHRLKTASDPKWSAIMTAELAGTERSRIQEAVQMQKMIEIFPELKDAKSFFQAQSWAKAKAASVARIAEVRSNPADFSALEAKIWLDDSVTAIKRVPSGSFRAIVTDPPFGIELDERPSGQASDSAYQDDAESYERLLSMAPDLYRVLKDDGWLVWFLGISWYERVKTVFRSAGFTVDEIPIVWDRTGGRCFTARPDRYFARGYDLALHCLKGNPELSARNRHNIFSFPPVPSGDQTLLVERPIELYAELIKHLTLRGECVADFFAGSGSVLAAAASLQRDFFGVELDPARRAVAIQKVRAYLPDGTSSPS